MCNEEPTASRVLAPGLELTSLLDTLPDALIFLDATATIQYANARAATMVGASNHELLGNTLWQCAPQLITTPLYQAVVNATRTRTSFQVEYRSPITQTWLRVYLSPISEGIALFFHEETEPTSLRNSTRQLYRRYLDLLESISDGVAILTPEGLVLEINERLLAGVQIRREKVVGKPFTDFPSGPSVPVAKEQLRAAIEQASQGETVHFEARICPQPGRYLDLALMITPHRDANQQIEYLICAGRDITERKQAEEELRTLVDAIPQLVWIAGPVGSIIYHNHRLIDYLAMTLEQVQGNGWLAAMHPDDKPRVREAWQTSIQTGVPYEVEHRMQDGTSGAYRWFLVRGVPQRNAQDTILHWVGTCTDIEEQKQAEEWIKASEQNWWVLAETVPQLVWTTLPDGSVEYWNQQWYAYSGSSPKQALGHRWSQFLHPDDDEHPLTVWHHALASGEAYE